MQSIKFVSSIYIILLFFFEFLPAQKTEFGSNIYKNLLLSHLHPTVHISYITGACAQTITLKENQPERYHILK